jgi:hypothetical protein
MDCLMPRQRSMRRRRDSNWHQRAEERPHERCRAGFEARSRLGRRQFGAGLRVETWRQVHYECTDDQAGPLNAGGTWCPR